MDLKELLSGKTADVEVKWEDEVVHVAFFKHAYTPELEAEVMKEADTGGGQALADLLARLVSDWDIVDQGDPWPPVRENIGKLPVSFLVAVMKAVSEAMTEDPLLSGTSDAPS